MLSNEQIGNMNPRRNIDYQHHPLKQITENLTKFDGIAKDGLLLRLL